MSLKKSANQQLGIKKISKDLDIPTPFLFKILQNMVRSKILSSNKGPHGGFGLAKKASDISLLEIIQAIDGLDIFEECLIGLRSCNNKSKDSVPCSTNRKFKPSSAQMYNFFKNETIKNLMNEIFQANGSVGI